MLTYLITGGAGFIGSHLTERLLRDGHRVIVIDDLSSGAEKNLDAARASSKFEFIRAGVEDSDAMNYGARQADTIFHLAATVGVFNIIQSPVETILNNVDGTKAVLAAATPRKVKTIVASTSEVYGKSLSAPFREDDDLLLGPTSRSRWSYAASKVVDEFLALAWQHEKGVPTVVTRFFNTIGPRQVGRYGMVVPRFLAQALAGEDLTVYGSGQQSRCFTYVDDVVEWLVRLANDDRASGQVFNLGNPSEISIEDLAKLVIEVSGSVSKIGHVSYQEAYEPGFEDISRRVPDIGKVTALTGYQPRVALREALERTRDWVAETMAAGATA